MKKVSQQRLLNIIFEKVFSEKFNKDEMDDRIMLQKAVYLLREFGVSCGEYDFVWDHYGPFSPDLSDDMKKEVTDCGDVEFTDKANRHMEQLCEIFSDNGEYSVRYWSEAVASLRYLMVHMYPLWSDEQIIGELEKEKRTLSKHEENVRAMKCVKQLFA